MDTYRALACIYIILNYVMRTRKSAGVQLWYRIIPQICAKYHGQRLQILRATPTKSQKEIPGEDWSYFGD